MHKCPTCDNGRMKITVSTYGSNEPATVTEIDCVYCDGTGQIDDETMEAIEYEKNMWCKCGNPSGRHKFYRDGEGPLVHKHHYVCKDCNKVLQIG